MASLPQAGVYRFKHTDTGTMLTLSSAKSIIGSTTDAGTKSRWRLSPASDIQGAYHVISVADDQHLFYDGYDNRMVTTTAGMWYLQSTGKPNEYFFHMQWNHYVAIIDKADKVAKVRRSRLHTEASLEKWILEFIGPLDKILPTLDATMCYPFAPGSYVIRNVGTGTVMNLDAVSKKPVGHQANGSKSQQWHLRPTGIGTCMAIKTLDEGGRVGVTDLKQDAAVGCYDQAVHFMLTFIRADKGFWIAHPPNPFLVYDLRGGNPADGTEICLWPMNDLDHQKWYFDPA